jgi:hypothetical protein
MCHIYANRRHDSSIPGMPQHISFSSDDSKSPSRVVDIHTVIMYCKKLVEISVRTCVEGVCNDWASEKGDMMVDILHSFYCVVSPRMQDVTDSHRVALYPTPGLSLAVYLSILYRLCVVIEKRTLHLPATLHRAPCLSQCPFARDFWAVY